MVTDRHFPGLSVGDVKARLSYPEFLDWLAYYQKEQEQRDKDEFYLAAIRLEVVRLRRQVARMINSSAPLGPEPSIQTYMLDFTQDIEGQGDTVRQVKKSGYTPADGKVYVEASKAAWAARLGLATPL